MNTDEKLALSARENIITFIREGVFCRGCQQSLFAYPGKQRRQKTKRKMYSGIPVT